MSHPIYAIGLANGDSGYRREGSRQKPRKEAKSRRHVPLTFFRLLTGSLPGMVSPFVRLGVRSRLRDTMRNGLTEV
jgi:hypothetical protein